MPSTHLSLHYHLIFSTKNREPWINPEWMPRLHAYLGGTVRELNGVPQEVGGIADHVHLLVGLRATHCLANVLRDIKAASSKWVHQEIGFNPFEWQEGYGAFTVSASMIPEVRGYIARQAEHHGRRSFKEGYVGLLKLSGVEFEEEFLW